MSGKSSNQVPETPQQRALVELAQKQVADYQQRWLPLQKNLAESISAMGAPDSRERRQALGMAQAETTARFAGAQDKLQTGLGQTGQLGTSKGKLAVAGLGADQATAAGLGATQTDQQIEDAYVAGLGSIMALGKGQKAEAIGGMTNVAALSGRRAADDARASLENRMGDAQLLGQVGGIGLAYAGMPRGSSVSTADLAAANASTDPMGELSRLKGWTGVR